MISYTVILFFGIPLFYIYIQSLISISRINTSICNKFLYYVAICWFFIVPLVPVALNILFCNVNLKNDDQSELLPLPTKYVELRRYVVEGDWGKRAAAKRREGQRELAEDKDDETIWWTDAGEA